MKLPLRLLLLTLGLPGTVVPAFAQVEKVAIRTTGISCGTCAFVSEIYLRRLAGVGAIKISLTNEAILVSYKPGALFQPKELREALKKTDVGVVEFQISARGHMQERTGHRVFVAGKDTFALVAEPGVPQVPSGTSVLIEAKLDDTVDPMQLKVMTVKPIDP